MIDKRDILFIALVGGGIVLVVHFLHFVFG